MLVRCQFFPAFMTILLFDSKCERCILFVCYLFGFFLSCSVRSAEVTELQRTSSSNALCPDPQYKISLWINEISKHDHCSHLCEDKDTPPPTTTGRGLPPLAASPLRRDLWLGKGRQTGDNAAVDATLQKHRFAIGWVGWVGVI